MQIAIAGSAKLLDRIEFWREWWQKRGAEILAYPQAVPVERYPELYQHYFSALNHIDLLFVMNEDRMSIKGYIGPQTFAEMSYVNARNLSSDQQVRIVLLKQPSPSVACYDEVKCWLELGWAEILDPNLFKA